MARDDDTPRRNFQQYAVDEMRGKKRRGKPKPKRRAKDRNRGGASGGNTGGGGGSPTAGGPDITVPDNPLTGPVKNAGLSGAGLEGIVRDTPTALITDALKAHGMNLTGGAGGLLASIASPDQIDTLIALSAARSGNPAATPGQQGNAILDFYNNMLGQGGSPNMAQLFGGAFGQGADAPDSPFYGLLTGGTPAEQLARLTSAVGDISSVAGMNPLARRALLSSLNAKGREYASSQGQVGANQTFVDFVRQTMPQVAAMLGAGTVAGNPPPVNTPSPGGGGGGGAGGGGGGGQATTGTAQAGRGGARSGNVRARSGKGAETRGRDDRGGGGGNRFADFVARSRGGGGGRGRNDGIGERAIAGANPNRLARQAAKGKGGKGKGSRANADAGTVTMGDINGPVELDINADAGRAYDSGSVSAASAPTRTGKTPGKPTDFQTYAAQNSPYTRPMPKVDVPGFDRAAMNWSNQTNALLTDRNNAYSAAVADHQDQLSAYDQAVRQAQEAQTARQSTMFGLPSLFKTRAY